MSHTTLSNNLFNKLFNEAILCVYRVTLHPPGTDCDGMYEAVDRVMWRMVLLILDRCTLEVSPARLVPL